MFVSVKSPILVVHRYVLVLASKKKTRWETCSHSSENRFNHPSRTSHRFSHTGALSIGKIKKTIFPSFVRPSVRPSVHFDLISHRMMIIRFQKFFLPFVLRYFLIENSLIWSKMINIDLYDWVLPTVYNDLFRNDFNSLRFYIWLSQWRRTMS